MISLIRQPYWWTSAHRPVEFEFEYEGRSCAIGAVVGSTKIGLLPSLPFSETPYAGQMIFIEGGDYNGYHIVKSYTLGIIILETDLNRIPSVSYTVRLITRHEFNLKIGYPENDVFLPNLFYPYLPYTQLAQFIPEPNSEGKLIVNIQGYLKGIFNPTNYKDLNPSTAIGHAGMQWATGLFNMYNLTQRRIDVDTRLGIYTRFINFRMVLNAAIDNETLWKYYVGTGASLTKEVPQIVFGSCDTEAMTLETAGVLYRRYTNGEPYFGEVLFTDSFNDSYQKQ